MIMKSLVSLVATFLFLNVFSQNEGIEKPMIKKDFTATEYSNTSNFEKAKVDSVLLTSPLITNLDSSNYKYFEAYNDYKKIKGYKIQLYSGSNRNEAEQIRSEFMNKYDVRPQLVYSQPNFKIRVGNYRDRNSAAKDLAFYKVEFESAFLVRDYLNNPSEQ